MSTDSTDLTLGRETAMADTAVDEVVHAANSCKKLHHKLRERLGAL